MKFTALFLALLSAVPAFGEVEINLEKLGSSLGGWKARKGKAAEYEISESLYRTYQPETSPSPDGGIFVSIRIDHVRGFMSSDDHASLELSFANDGTLVTAQSSLALQGRTISSELIKGGASASTSVAAPYVDRAVKIGTDLVADLSSKLLREKIVEPGRVSFPAAIRHNYNLIYQSVQVKADKPAMPSETTGAKPPESLPEDKKPAEKTEAPAPAPEEKKPEKPAKPGTKTVFDAHTKKEVPLPAMNPYNGNGAPTTPLPANTKAEMLGVGKEALKIARDVVKEGMK